MLSALVGIYDLRLADAHLASSEVHESFRLTGVDEDAPLVHQGLQLLHACVSAIYEITSELERWDEPR